MIRLLLSIIIVTLLVTYAILPFIEYFKKCLKAEGKRIERSLSENKIKKDDL